MQVLTMSKKQLDYIPLASRPMLSGVYSIFLKHKNRSVPTFFDCQYFERPRRGDRHIYNGKQYVVVGFNGIPPLGEIIMFEYQDADKS